MKFNKQIDCGHLENVGWTYDLLGNEKMKVLVPNTFLGIKLPFNKEEVIDVIRWIFAYKTVINEKHIEATVIISVDAQDNIRSYLYEAQSGENNFSFFEGESFIRKADFTDLVKGHLKYFMGINKSV